MPPLGLLRKFTNGNQSVEGRAIMGGVNTVKFLDLKLLHFVNYYKIFAVGCQDENETIKADIWWAGEESNLQG